MNDETPQRAHRSNGMLPVETTPVYVWVPNEDDLYEGSAR